MHLGELCFVLWGIFIGFFIWQKRKGDISDKKVKGMKGIFHAGCLAGLCAFRQRFRYRIKGERLEQLKKVYVGKTEEEIFYAYYGKICDSLCVMIMCSLLVIALSSLIPKSSKLIEGYYLKREGVLGEEKYVSLYADYRGEEKELQVPVANRQYTKAQLEEKFKEAKDFVDRNYLGENSSSEKITKPLNLVATVPQSAISISWKLEQDGLIKADGGIGNDELEEGCQTEITVVFSYGEEKRKDTKMLTILPRQKTREELYWKEWQRQFELNQKESQADSYLKLPDCINGQKVQYCEKDQVLPYMVVGMALFLPVIIVLLTEERLRKEILYREKELRFDYPEFVEQFVLLVGAGLNVKGAWQRIAEDYIREGRKKHYVYEEMLVSVREMEHGMSEVRAYELFGKRTGLLQYMKFCTLIVQNLRKGSEDLLKLLDYEVADAFRERKENAKALGEEAGTKLLLPMMLMLVVVFALILYAAFYNM